MLQRNRLRWRMAWARVAHPISTVSSWLVITRLTWRWRRWGSPACLLLNLNAMFSLPPELSALIHDPIVVVNRFSTGVSRPPKVPLRCPEVPAAPRWRGCESQHCLAPRLAIVACSRCVQRSPLLTGALILAALAVISFFGQVDRWPFFGNLAGWLALIFDPQLARGARRP